MEGSLDSISFVSPRSISHLSICLNDSGFWFGEVKTQMSHLTASDEVSLRPLSTIALGMKTLNFPWHFQETVICF